MTTVYVTTALFLGNLVRMAVKAVKYVCQADGCPRTANSKWQANAEGWASEYLDSCNVRYFWCPDHVEERREVVAAHGHGDEDGPP